MARRGRRRTGLRAADARTLAVYSYHEDRLEEALRTGKDAQLLELYFGEPRYQELRALAREAPARAVRGGPRVLVLPGIMGSTVGRRRAGIDDVLWFDPLDILAGRLVKLTLANGPGRFTALGLFPLVYVALKLRLRIAGFDVDSHPYDWRQSLEGLGRELAGRLRRESAPEVHLVAHSMGGLVARAAIAQGAPRIARLVMLGTPNHGSFAPVQALRAVHPTVRQVAALDPFHTPEELASTTFNTFDGLYQMLPTPEKWSDLDLYDQATWPARGPRPRQDRLDGVRPVQAMLARADERFFLVAGVNQETVTGLRPVAGEFVYDHSLEGDGTVPLVLAELEGARTWYVEEAHGSLPANRAVAQAVIDLIRDGKTSVLPDRWAAPRRALTRSLRDGELRIDPFEGRRGAELTPGEIRRMLEPLLSPEARDVGPEAPAGAPAVTAPGYAHALEQVVVGRRRQHRIDVRLALGSITEVDARAYVLGIFRDVAPSGAALALDARLGGAIGEFSARRMFSGNVGEVFVLPTGRHPLPADFIVFAGLGHFDRFTGEVQQLAAENVIRTCIRTHVEEFATLLFGAGSGHGVEASLGNLLAGFVRGLRDADRDHRFRRITLCEMSPARHGEIKRELLRLSSTALFEDIEVTFDEVTLRAPLLPAEPVRAVRGPDPVYLIVRHEAAGGGRLALRSSVLTAGAKAAVISEVKAVKAADLERHLRRIESAEFTFAAVDEFGEQLGALVLADSVAAVLPEMKGHPVVVVHDRPSSRIPWEALRIRSWSPAADVGLSRRYVADDLSVAKWLEQRRHGPVLDVLMVVNPTLDLQGAEEEGKRIRDLFGTHPAVKLEEVRGQAATKPALLQKFQSGQYDVIHYAGHAFFDEANPPRSGLLCHGHEVLSGADLASIGNLPSLVFFNACEAGRVRGGRRGPGLRIEERIERSVGFAEAFMRGGVANFVGTYWPVGDAAASRFADVFYSALLRGATLGAALTAGRVTVRDEVKSVDWADYIHYGDHDFAIKEG